MTAAVRNIVAALVLIAVLAALALHFRARSRSVAAEARVGAAQTEALAASAKEAIATQGAAQAREAASEALSNSNEKEIRDAEGADEAVAAPVRDAGLASLCRRSAYRDGERCRLLRADTG